MPNDVLNPRIQQLVDQACSELEVARDPSNTPDDVYRVWSFACESFSAALDEIEDDAIDRVKVGTEFEPEHGWVILYEPVVVNEVAHKQMLELKRLLEPLKEAADVSSASLVECLTDETLDEIKGFGVDEEAPAQSSRRRMRP